MASKSSNISKIAKKNATNITKLLKTIETISKRGFELSPQTIRLLIDDDDKTTENAIFDATMELVQEMNPDAIIERGNVIYIEDTSVHLTIWS